MWSEGHRRVTKFEERFPSRFTFAFANIQVRVPCREWCSISLTVLWLCNFFHTMCECGLLVPMSHAGIGEPQAGDGIAGH